MDRLSSSSERFSGKERRRPDSLPLYASARSLPERKKAGNTPWNQRVMD
jgi:hypothetical protein